MVSAAKSLIYLLSYLFSKNSGMVRAPSAVVIYLVRFASTIHAARVPMIMLPTPIHTAESPKFHPNLPAYPTKTTAEK